MIIRKVVVLCLRSFISVIYILGILRANIIRLCNRPFVSVEEMNETIIANWNAVVFDDDDVYVGGDVCFKSAVEAVKFLKRLRGKKHLIVGNHDNKLLKDPAFRKMFVEITDILEVNDNGTRIVISHYPLCEWNGFFRGTLHFYGHIHNNTENATYGIMKNISNAYNIGADILGFTPRTLEQVIEMNKRFFEEK